jgi:hypothetical protein
MWQNTRLVRVGQGDADFSRGRKDELKSLLVGRSGRGWEMSRALHEIVRVGEGELPSLGL